MYAPNLDIASSVFFSPDIHATLFVKIYTSKLLAHTKYIIISN